MTWATHAKSRPRNAASASTLSIDGKALPFFQALAACVDTPAQEASARVSDPSIAFAKVIPSSLAESSALAKGSRIRYNRAVTQPRLPGVPKRRKGRARYTPAERRALKPRSRPCARCGRALKSPSSIKAGIGPGCRAAVAKAARAARQELPMHQKTFAGAA